MDCDNGSTRKWLTFDSFSSNDDKESSIVMSDDEDNAHLINEIQALEEALVQQNDNKDEKRSNIPSTSGSCKTELFSQKIQDESEESDSSVEHEENLIINDDTYAYNDCKDLQDLYELNKKLIETLLRARDKAVLLQKECKKNQKIVEERISKHNAHWHAKIITFNAGMPYFKDKNYFAPKRNADSERKVKNGELRLSELQRIHRWTQQDKSNLLKAIRHEVALNLLRKSEPAEAYIDNNITKSSQLPTDVKKAIGPLGSMKFDWLKIANNICENKHTAEECEVMWNVFLHPDINKQKYTNEEDETLKRLVEEYENEDWDTIAYELNTKRSGYQCFVRYNTNNWKNLMKGQAWTPADDKTLTHLVNKLSIGDFIPWGYIASCMNYWTKQQVYFRWIYSLAPNLKKGRFSEEEDKQLLEAVKKYGQNFSKISALVMTNRTNTQLKEHYFTMTIKANVPKKVWTFEEDEALIQLKKKYGPNWSKIVQEMNSGDITRVMARQRYQSLLRYQEKGVKLQNICREVSEDPLASRTILYTTNSPWSQESKEIHVKYLKIDDQLTNFFKEEIASQNEKFNTKTYPLNKLTEDTRKLYKILSQFNTKLDIPETIDNDYDLSEIQMQLLSSLKDFMEEKKINMTDRIEKARMQMFGPQEPLPQPYRFVPPLPFGFCFPKYASVKRKKFLPIDYLSDCNEYHQIKDVMELRPDQHVSNYIGEEIENQFEKLKKIMVQWPKNAKKVYSLKCRPFANSGHFFEEIEVIDGDRYKIYTPSPNVQEEMIYSWELNKMVPKNSTEKKLDLNVEGVPAQILKPSITTLQAYQILLGSSQSFPSEPVDVNKSNKLSSRGREALYNFKRRYEQIVHIPTGLSRVIPPDIVDASAFLPALEKYKKSMKRKRPKRLN